MVAGRGTGGRRLYWSLSSRLMCTTSSLGVVVRSGGRIWRHFSGGMAGCRRVGHGTATGVCASWVVASGGSDGW